MRDVDLCNDAYIREEKSGQRSHGTFPPVVKGYLSFRVMLMHVQQAERWPPFASLAPTATRR